MRWLFRRDKRAALYVHFPCFDGVVSGVLASRFLEKTDGWKVTAIVPVNYGLRNQWLETKLPPRSGVLDFLYHPQAEFWADHHSTTFLTPQLQASFEAATPKNHFYDSHSPSCASLLWRHLGASLGNESALQATVEWADKIDSAAYASVQEALFDEHPALLISKSLAIDADAQYCEFLIRKLKHSSLDEAARSEEVQKRNRIAKERSALGLERVRKAIRMEGAAAVFEASDEGVLINRYLPYHFYPDAQYSIGVVHFEASTKITTMRNPWMEFESPNLGRFMEKFGGGGHQRVGSVILENGRQKLSPEIVSALLQLENSESPLKV
ncbi:MAG TPA: hypothetical protein VLW06_13505 [Terriglobales bacterium]|nr:hypothetical protein [Terriglobales bacterium]